MADVYQGYRDRLAELTAKRDAKYKELEPIQKQLDEVNERIAALQEEQYRLAVDKQTVLGGQAWLDLKKEIAALSKLLSGK